MAESHETIIKELENTLEIFRGLARLHGLRDIIERQEQTMKDQRRVIDEQSIIKQQGLGPQIYSISLADLYAGFALAGMYANMDIRRECIREEIIQAASIVGDALAAERLKQKEPKSV